MPHTLFLNRVTGGCLLSACCLLLVSHAAAAEPAKLLPPTTQGMVGVHDIHALESNWESTQLGQLINDPQMQPFVKDVERQLRSRLMETRLRLGIQLSQLSNVGTGALAIANTQPGSQKTEHALLLVVAVQGKETAARALMNSAAESLGGGAAVSMGAYQALKAHVPGASGQKGHSVFYAVQHGHLFACDNATGLREAVTATGGGKSLAQEQAYQAVMKRTQAPAGGQSEIQWYLDLFGYAQVCQAMTDGDGKVAQLLAGQGFDSVKCAGGQIQLATAEHELLHQTFIYTPEGTDQLKSAAQLLAFVNSAETSQPLTWVPGGVANHLQLKFNFQEAFKGVKPLVNAIAQDDVFDSMLENIAKEPNGPRVDIRREVLPYVGSRVTILSDRVPPVSADSERLLAAVEVRNEQAIRNAFNRWLRTEPRMRSVRFHDHMIWEYVPEEPPANDGLALDIEGADSFGFEDDGGFGFEDAQPASAPVATPEQLLPKIAVTVARGHVLVSTHIDYLKATLKRANHDELESQADFTRVRQALEKLGGGLDTAHFFTRLDAALEVPYELVRTGQIAESPSLMGTAMRLLNQPGSPQTQQLDASSLPPFINVAKYLGPHGLFLQEHEEGWLMTGCLLSK